MRLHTGRLRGIALAVVCLAAVSASAAIRTVTNTNDSGPGSLRQAILDASPGDSVHFAIGSGPRTIQPLTALPLAEGITIDGRTQPGYAGTPLIELDGILAEYDEVTWARAGLFLQDSTVHAIAVNRFVWWGILAYSSEVYDCWIGFDPHGNLKTDAATNTGMSARAGVYERNVIAGHRWSFTTFGNEEPLILRDNRFGTDPTGSIAVGEPAQVQVHVEELSPTPSTVELTGNVIGNGISGVWVLQAQDVTIQENHIGMTAAGAPIPNQVGISATFASDVEIRGNRIRRNIGQAINVGHESMRVSIRENEIEDNGWLGILLGNGDTTNDHGDADDGPNGLINHPELSRIISVDGTSTITGTLDSVPNRTYTIELFQSGQCDPSGYGEGALFIDSFEVTTNGSGTASFERTLAQSLAAGTVITATSTSALEGTSQFARCTMVEGRGGLTFEHPAALAYEHHLAVTLKVRRVRGAVGTVTVEYATADGAAVAGQDYVAISGVLTFTDGETEKTITIPIVDDPVYETQLQSFAVILSNPTGGASLVNDPQTTVYVVSFDPRPEALTTDLQLPEGNSGTTPFTWQFTLSRPSEVPLTLEYETAGESATEDADFAPVASFLTFAPGQLTQNVTVSVHGDTLFEGHEEFRLMWRIAGDIFIDAATATIVEDDPLPSVHAGDVTVVEGDDRSVITITFTASQPISGHVQYGTFPQTATAGVDYTPQGGDLEFNNETTSTIAIELHGDDETESNEQFELRFDYPIGTFTAPSPVVITITDDDVGIGPRRIELQAGESAEGVIRTGAPAADDAVFTITSGVPALVSVPATVTLPAGSSEVTFPIAALAAGGGANVDVTIPAAYGGGTQRIRVETYREAQLTLSPADLELFVDQGAVIHATIEPANSTPVTVRLAATGTIDAPESFLIAPGGAGTFEIRGASAGAYVLTATLPVEFGRAEFTIGGRVLALPVAPAITGIAPAEGSSAGGTAVEISGANFRADCVVRFGGVPALSTTFVDAQTLRSVTPPHAAGVADVTLTCGSEKAIHRGAFTYRAAHPALTSVAPPSGHTGGGTYVRISGRDFTPECWPFFGDAAATAATVRDAQTIDAVTPAHAAGAVAVRLVCTGDGALLADGFTFVATVDAAPQINSAEPLFAAPGDVVTLTGTGFRPNDGVLFGDVSAQVLDATPTTLKVVVPDVVPGRVELTIARNTVSALSDGAVMHVTAGTPPRVDRVSPAAAMVVSELVLEGAGMRDTYSFALDGKPLTIVSMTPSRTVVRLPSDVVAGTYALQIVNAAGEVAPLGPQVTVSAEGMLLAYVDPRCGPADGGIDVTIDGFGFANGAAVTFDDVAATNVTVLDFLRIQARIPAGSAGPAVVAVTNPDGTRTTLTNFFRYTSPFDPNGCGSGRTRTVRH